MWKCQPADADKYHFILSNWSSSRSYFDSPPHWCWWSSNPAGRSVLGALVINISTFTGDLNMAQSTGPAVSPLFSTGTSARSCLHLSTWARSCNRLKSSLINCLLSCVIALFSMVAQDWRLWSTGVSLCRYICVCSPFHLRDAALLISSGTITKKTPRKRQFDLDKWISCHQLRHFLTWRGGLWQNCTLFCC